MDILKARAEARKTARPYIERVDDWARANLAPVAARQDRAQRYEPDALAALRNAGLLSLEAQELIGPGPELLPERPGMSAVADAIRGLSRTDPGVAVLVHVHNTLATRCLARFGDDAQKQQWLPFLARSGIGAFAATEPHAGSDLARMSTALSRGNSGGFVLNGEKYWITNAAEAAVLLVFARFERTTACVIVPADADGVEIGPRIDKMSMRASSTCAVRFSEVHLPPESLLGGEAAGMDVAMYGLVCGRIGIAAQMLGLAEGALRRAVDYARDREAFGEAIIGFQGVSFPLAQIRAETIAMAHTLDAACAALDNARSYMSALELANVAKLLASQLAEKAAGLAVETLGGNGVAEGFEVEKFYRDAKVGKIYEGTVNVLLRALSAGPGGRARHDA